MILSFNNFRKGLHDPAKCRLTSGGGNRVNVDTEFTTLKNMFPDRQGRLTRRGGLTSVANLKTGSAASTSFIANKGMFWHPGLSKWVVAASTGQLYEVTEGSAVGAVLKMIDIARNRMTVAWTNTANSFYEVAGQAENFAFITSAGVYSYYGNPGRSGYSFERGNYWCRTYYIAGVGGNKAYTQVDVNGVIYITPGAVTVPTVMGGTLPFNNYLLLIKADGKVFRYSGVTASDAYLIQIGGNLGEPVLYTLTDCSPYGLMFTTKTDDYLIYRVPEIANEIDLMSVTKDKFDTSLTNGIDNGATTNSDLVQYANVADDVTTTVTCNNTNSLYPVSKMTDGSVSTYTQLDFDLTTGKTASASNVDGTNVAANAINVATNPDTLYFKTPTTAVTSSEYLRIDLGEGGGKAVKSILAKSSLLTGSYKYIFGPNDAAWNLQGSNDAVAWTTLAKANITHVGDNDEHWYWRITNTTVYRYYQLIGDTVDRGAGVFYVQVNDLCLFDFDITTAYNHSVQLDFGAATPRAIKKALLYTPWNTVYPYETPISTTITSLSTGTTLNVASTTGVVVGREVQCGAGTPKEVVEIESIPSAVEITLVSPGLIGAYSSGTITMLPLTGTITSTFETSNNGTDWTAWTPTLKDMTLVSGTGYWYNFYQELNTTTQRYFKITRSCQGNYVTFFSEIQIYSTTTFSDTDTGYKSGGAWNSGTMEWYRWFTNTSGAYVCHVYNPAKKIWWQFDTGSFGGTMAANSSDLYCTLNQYTIASVLYPSGIYKLRTDGLGSDPDAAFATNARAGWLDLPGDYECRNVEIKGKGLTTCNLYWEWDSPAGLQTGTITKTLTGLTPTVFPPENTRPFNRISWEVIGSVGITDTTKEVYIDEVNLDVEFIRDFTGGRSKK